MKRLLLRCIILFFLFCSVFACKSKKNNSSQAKHATKMEQPVPASKEWYAIKKFVDGDTFWLDDGSPSGIKVRLIGMDTPEPRNVFKKKMHPMGKEVSDYVEALLSGKKVRIELDVDERDQYGRVLVYVYLEDGSMLNEHLLAEGKAMLMTIPPNIKYEQRFVAAQQKAREQHKGLWGMPYQNENE